MTGVWIGVAAAVAVLLGVSAGLLLASLRGRSSRAVVVGLRDSTSMDRDSGAVRSVQRADLELDEAALAELWTPEPLERLARTYWRFLGRVTLGIIRVHYSPEQRSVVLLIPQLKLLTF